MANFLHKLLFIVLLIVLSTPLFGQPPANDNCDDAIAVALDEEVTFSTVEAITDGPAHADDCTSSGTTPDSTYKDIWYTFTPEITGTVLWSLCGGTLFDTKIFVYGPGASCLPTDDDILACNEDGGGLCDVTSEVFIDVMAGETYLLRLGGFGDGPPGESGEGSFTIEEFIPTVPNDDCANAIPIGLTEAYEFNTSEATTDGPDHLDSPCFQFGSTTAGRDIWFTFTPDFTGFVEWSTCDMITFDSRLAVYGPDVSCPVEDGDLYACNDDGPGCASFTSKMTFEVEAGKTYLLRLGGFSNDAGFGTFSLLQIIPPDPPANDLCENADPTPYIIDRESADNLDVIFEGTTLDATFDDDSFIFPVCLTNQSGGEFATVWYQFNSLANTEIELRVNAVTPGSIFYADLFETCLEMVDTAVVESICLRTTEDETFVADTLGVLPAEEKEYLLRITTRLTSDVPGEFWFQLVGDIFVDTQEPELGSFKFFPNPATDVITTEFSMDASARIGLQVHNTLGQSVYQEDKGVLTAGKHSLQFNVQELPPGIYFFNLIVDEAVKSQKFIKH